jgi:CRP-like cAMP-binding protein
LVPTVPETGKKPSKAADAVALLQRAGVVATLGRYRRKETIFNQGSRADTVYYLERGRVTLGVVSKQGKEAVIAILPPGSFFGEGSLAGQTVNVATATAFMDCSVFAFKKK